MMKVRKDIAYRRISGELFIVDAARSRMHELNGPAAVIWEGLAAGRDEARIVSDIAAEFEVDEVTARADLRAFTAELQTAGLIVRT